MAFSTPTTTLRCDTLWEPLRDPALIVIVTNTTMVYMGESAGLSAHHKPPFGEVAEKELAVLYRVARRLTRNDTDAEDLVGSALYNAARGYANFDGRHPRSWMIRILRNEWLQTVRAKEIRPETQLDDSIDPADDGFWREVETRLDVEAVLGSLDRLPEEYRLAVVLCDVEQMTYEEAGIAMDVPVGTVRSRLFRGRKLLQARLGNSTETL